MMEHSTLNDIKRAIVEEAHSDVVGLWAILWQVKQELPTVTAQEAMTATLAVVAAALSEQAIVAGNFVDKDEGTTAFVPWLLNAEDAVARIREEWWSLGREPNLGEIAWFVDPQILPVSAVKHPMGKYWRPKPA